jgi:hypothetical protein
MDKTDLAQVTSKDESNLEAAPQNDSDTARVGTRPTFLGRTHQCVSGIWGLLVVALTIVQVYQGSYYTYRSAATEREHRGCRLHPGNDRRLVQPADL